MRVSYNATLESWSRSLEIHEIESHGHIRRVTDETLQLAEVLGVEKEELPGIERGALLHDIGKIGILDEILLKRAKLSEEEWDEIRKHPAIAKELLADVPFLKDSLDIPYSHHENWDGSGYPQGLKEEEIPLHARIFSVVETFDALTSDRPFRKAWTRQAATAYLQEQRGKKFDPRIVDVFLSMIES